MHYIKLMARACVLLSLLIANNVSAQTEFKTFNGTLTVPSGVLVDGNNFQIEAVVIDSMGFDTGVTTAQLFAYDMAQDSYPFSVAISDTQFFDETGFLGDKIVLRFLCGSCDATLLETYYNSVEATPYQGLAESLTNFNINSESETINGLDFNALEGETLSVELVLPGTAQEPLSGDVSFGVQVVDIDGFASPGFESQGITSGFWGSQGLPISDAVAGVISLQVQVPSLPAGYFYQLEYFCSNDCSAPIWSGFGFYNSVGTVVSIDQAERFTDISQTLSIDMLEQVTFSGDLVRGGTIDLVAPFQSDICVTDVITGNQHECLFALDFADNQTSASFSLTAPKTGTPQQFTLVYDCEFYNCPDQAAPRGYYSPDGSFASQDALPSFLPSEGQSQISFNMLETQALSGFIALPNGRVVGDGEDPVQISLNVFDFSSSTFASTSVEIGPMNNSAEYSLGLANFNGDFQFSYSCDSGCEGLLTSGFIENNAFVSGFPNTQLFDVSSLQGLTLNLLEAVTLDVVVERPDGSSSDEFLFGSVQLTEDFSGETYSADFEMQQGESSKMLGISVPADISGEFYLQLNCFGCPEILETAYYDGTGTSFDFSQRLRTTDLTSLEAAVLPLIASVPFSFEVRLPGDAPSTGDNFLFLSLTDEVGNSLGGNADVSDFPGQVVFNIPSGLDAAVLRYDCFGCTDVSEQGYFNGTEFSLSFQDGALTTLSALEGTSLELLAPFKFDGVIGLPNGATANGDITVQVNLFDPFGGGFLSQEVTILDGQSDTPFEFDVFRFGNYSLSYFCSNCAGYLTSGNFDGTVFTPGAPSQIFDLLDIDDQRFEIIEAVQVDGVVARPDGADTSAELEVVIRAETNSASFSTSVLIPAAQASTPFTLDLPDATSTYRLSYECFECEGVFATGYFTSTGASAQFADAESFDDIEARLADNLVLIPTFNLEVTLRRPAGSATDEAVSFVVELSGLSDDGFRSQTFSGLFVTIPEGQDEISLLFEAPEGQANGFRLSATCTDCNDSIFSEANYQPDGSTLGEATSALSQTDLEAPIVFELLATRTVQGNVQLPASVTPEEDTSLFVSASLRDENGSFITNGLDFVTIPISEIEGEAPAAVEFSIVVPDIANASLSYDYFCASCSDFIVPSGFYSDAGTTEDPDEAQSFTLDTLPASIDFTLLEAATVAGTISRPDEASVEEALFIQLAARDFADNSGFARSIFFEIPIGETEVDFIIPVPRNTDLFFTYFCFGCDGVWRVAHYASQGAQVPVSNAEFLNSGEEGLVDVDIQLVKSLSVAGTLSRNSTDTNTAEVLPNVLIDVVDETGARDPDFLFFGFGQQLVIAENELETQFSIEMPELLSGGYNVRYDCPAGCGEDTFSDGYFSQLGEMAVIDQLDATLLTNADDLQNVSFSMVAGRTIFGELAKPLSVDPAMEFFPSVVARSVDESGVVGSVFPSFAPTTLPELVTTVAYSITVPANDDSFRVEYDCVACDGIYGPGYYGATQTEFAAQNAELIDQASSTFSDINLTLLESTVVGGELSRASGAPEDEDLFALLSVSALDADGEPIGQIYPLGFEVPDLAQTQNYSPTIPALATSLAYSVTIPAIVAETGFNVGYDCVGCSQTSDAGFFNSVVTVVEQDDAEDVTNTGSLDILSLNFEMLFDQDNDEVPNTTDNCDADQNADQANLDQDEFGDICDTDIDGDNVDNENDADQLNALICSDGDSDSCEDCSSGVFNLNDDGLDTDLDGMCDLGDTDDDGDTVLDAADCAPLDLNRFQLLEGYLDVDEDTIGVGALQPACSGASLATGFAPLLTGDNCPNVANTDQANFDGDSFGDICDVDSDNDNVEDVDDSDPFDPRLCSDSDNDQCDDCNSGTFSPLNDGADSDQDGLCNIGDTDDDDDGIEDGPDNCPLDPNPLQEDSDGNGVGDVCEGFCVPVKSSGGNIVLICL